jgi:hypothetical protein
MEWKQFAIALAVFVTLGILWRYALKEPIKKLFAKIKRRSEDDPTQKTPGTVSQEMLYNHCLSQARFARSMARQMKFVLALLVVALGANAFSGFASFKAWSKGNQTLRAERHLMEAVAQIDSVPLPAERPATETAVVPPPKAPEPPDECARQCTPVADLFEGKPLMEKLDGDFVFFEGKCTGPTLCANCGPAGMKRDVKPIPFCRRKN